MVQLRQEGWIHHLARHRYVMISFTHSLSQTLAPSTCMHSYALCFLLSLILMDAFMYPPSIACFFTRGDLWQSWEKGAEIFDLYLLDSDWALNNANWQWLSCSNFFYQYFRCYSPIAFGKKTDKNGDYIRKYLPQLAKFPAKVCQHDLFDVH